jgi:hypothetical protein
MMLHSYDTVLTDREDQLKLYKSMLRGDYSHLKLQRDQENEELLRENNKDIV